MTLRQAHLWAIAYNDPRQADHARAEVTALAGAGRYLLLLDVAILSDLSRPDYSTVNARLGLLAATNVI